MIVEIVIILKIGSIPVPPHVFEKHSENDMLFLAGESKRPGKIWQGVAGNIKVFRCEKG